MPLPRHPLPKTPPVCLSLRTSLHTVWWGPSPRGRVPSVDGAGCRNSVWLASRRGRFAALGRLGVWLSLRLVRGWAVPPVLFSVSLRARSFWLPCPPPFGRLRPARPCPALRPGSGASASAVAAFPFLLGLAWGYPFLMGWFLGLLRLRSVAGWRFLWGFSAASRPPRRYATPCGFGGAPLAARPP